MFDHCVHILFVFLCVRYFNGQGDVKYETKFDVPFKYDLPEPPGSWALYGDRVITLGTNVYVVSLLILSPQGIYVTCRFSVEKAGPAPPPAPTPVSEGAGEEKQLGGEETGESSAMTAELQLLKRLLVGIRAPASDSECREPLFLLAHACHLKTLLCRSGHVQADTVQ